MEIQLFILLNLLLSTPFENFLLSIMFQIALDGLGPNCCV